MSAFDIAIAALFSDPNLAECATYIPQVGADRSVTIVMRAPDVIQKIGSSMVDTPSHMLEVRVANCPLLCEGDQFLIGRKLYTVQGTPQRDELQLTWLVDLYAS